MIEISLNRAAPNEAMAVYEHGTRALRAISAEFGDYSQRVLADGTTTATRMAAAKSVPEAMDLMTAFSKRTFEEHMQQMSRIASMVASASEEQTRAYQSLYQNFWMPRAG
jgi:hypothetical protein